jgi:two-component system response regulator YesN
MYHNLEYKVTEKIDLIMEYIQHSYMNDISINQIASKFDLTPNYVSKLFHDKTNTKFIDYLTNIRISHAKKLLISNSDTPIKEIALMIGYYSSRHFSSIFKKYTGLYPTEYRKNHIIETVKPS